MLGHSSSQIQSCNIDVPNDTQDERVFNVGIVGFVDTIRFVWEGSKIRK